MEVVQSRVQRQRRENRFQSRDHMSRGDMAFVFPLPPVLSLQRYITVIIMIVRAPRK